MFSDLRKMIGSIHVVEEGNFIRIEGLPSHQYLNDLVRIWRTSKIGLNLFSKVTSSYVVFHKFFLPEVLYTLQKVLEEPKKGYAFHYRAMRKTIEELQTQTWYAQTQHRQPNILDFSQLEKLNLKLFDYQQEFLELYNERTPQFQLKGYMLGADPGTGKTISSLALSTCLEADVTIAIVPKNSIDKVWAGTLETLFKTTPSFWVSSSDEPLVVGKKFYVFHYEQLARAVEFFKSHPGRKPMVILDESHNMNEIDSLRTELFITLCKVLNCKHVLWMSGTPIKAIGKEVVPLLRTIDPFFDKNAEERFLAVFGKSSSKGLDIVANRLGMVVHRVTKANVIVNETVREELKVASPNGKQFTLAAVADEMRAFVMERMEYYRTNFAKYEKQYDAGLRVHEKQISHDRKKLHDYEIYTRYVKMIRTAYDPETMKEESKYCNRYEKLIGAGLNQPLKDEFRNAKSVVKYYNLKVQGEALGRILGKRRMQCNLEIAKYVDFEVEIDQARKKTLIFTSYVEVVDLIYARLVEQGYKPTRVYGTTNKDLPNIIGRFEKDPDVNPLIATFQSLSTAVPMVMASTSIMMNSPFRVGEMEQTEARTDRVGQDGPIKFVNVFLETNGEPNLSTRSNEIMEWSRKQVEQLMGIKVVDELTLEAFSEPPRLDGIVNEAYEVDSVSEELLADLHPHCIQAIKLPSMGW